VFGWLDAPAPLLTVAAWAFMVGALLLVGSVRAHSRAEIASWALPTVVAVVLPIALEAPRINTLGTFFQGRYVLPMTVAAVLVLATRPSVADTIDGAGLRLRRVVAVLWFAGQVAAFVTAWRRYATGLDGPLLSTHPSWQPPGGFVTLVAFVLFAALVAAVIGGGAPVGAGGATAPAMRGSPRATPEAARLPGRPARAARPARGVAPRDVDVRRSVGRALPPSPPAQPDR